MPLPPGLSCPDHCTVKSNVLATDGDVAELVGGVVSTGMAVQDTVDVPCPALPARSSTFVRSSESW